MKVNITETRAIVFGYWSGFAVTEDGHFKYRETPDGWRVWRFDGRQFRRVKHWPDYLLESMAGSK